jgi:RNA polymerase sigma-70 factor (ECF subfamily)
MGITIKKHRRNLSYDDAITLDEFWVIAKQFDRSLYREWKDHWDERCYDEYIVVTEGRLPYCELPEQYVCRMETRREILAVLALCTEKQRERFLLYALYDFSYEEVGRICGCSKVAVHLSIEAVRKKFLKFSRNLLNELPFKTATR